MNTMKRYAFGIDLGGTTTKLGLFTTDGTLLEKWEIPTRTAEHGAQILPDIAASLKDKLTEKGIGADEVQGAGIGVPGAVLRGSYVAPCVNLNQWGGFEVSEALYKLCGFPVKMTNDANAAALGEMWQGGAKGYDNVVFVTLGTGVGGGIVVDGKILEGTHGAGGEIGHMKVDETETRACGCGKHGCLEQYASATGIVYLACTLLAGTDQPSALRDFPSVSAKNVFDCAKTGDALALRVVDQFANKLGRALASVSCVCDPDVIVIGGGVSAAGDILLNAVQKQFVLNAFPSAEGTEFRLASLGNEAGIYGGVRLMLN